MGENLKISKWGITVLVGIAGVFVTLAIQTALASRWAGSVTSDLNSIKATVNETKADLTRRIERIEDRENRKP